MQRGDGVVKRRRCDLRAGAAAALACGGVAEPSSGAVSAMAPPSAGVTVVGEFAVVLRVVVKAVVALVEVRWRGW